VLPATDEAEPPWQNLVLLDQDELHVLSTFCFQLNKYKKRYHMMIFRGATMRKSIPECWIIGAQVLGVPRKFCENGKVMQPNLEMPSWRILSEGGKASRVNFRICRRQIMRNLCSSKNVPNHKTETLCDPWATLSGVKLWQFLIKNIFVILLSVLNPEFYLSTIRLAWPPGCYCCWVLWIRMLKREFLFCFLYSYSMLYKKRVVWCSVRRFSFSRSTLHKRMNY